MNLFRAVVLACGLGLAACSSGVPDLGLDVFTSKPATTVLTIESSPPGAEARTSLGPTCRTPCTLPIASTTDFTVSYALNGYEPQTVNVHASLPPAGFLPSFSASAPTIEPNPVFATLLPVPPPAKPARAPPKRRRRPPPAAAAAPETPPPVAPQPPPSLGGFAPPPGTFTPSR
jgi:hypothetical protein